MRQRKAARWRCSCAARKAKPSIWARRRWTRGADSWSGTGVLPDGSEAADGVYTVAVQLRNYWGEESEESLLPLTIGETNAAVSGVPDTLDLNSLDIQEAQIWEGGIEEAQVWDEGETANGELTADENGRRPVPQATSFWDMNPDEYDLTDPDHQQAIWDLMMQPITVMDVGQTEHVYPTFTPGANRKPYEQNCAGELYGRARACMCWKRTRTATAMC